MLFTGRLFFDFDSYDVWRIYTTMVKASQERDVAVEVDWRPFLVEDIDSEADMPSHTRGLAACEAVRDSHPEQYDRFVGAMMTLTYQEKDDPGSDKTLAVAAQVAGVDRDAVIGRALDPGLRLLEKATVAARERGVSDVPTIERQGPPVYIKTTGAANYGNAVERLELINRMLDEDGIWTLAKP